MERSPSSASNTPSSLRYVGWKEVVACTGGGSRIFRYYLNRSDGRADLAVVGKENMPYRCVLRRRRTFGLGDPEFDAKKLRSRRDIIDWLDSILSGLERHDHHEDRKLQPKLDAAKHKLSLEGSQSLIAGSSCGGGLWLGSPWTCRKPGRHYTSFQRHGVKITVHDFVYVLSDDNRRLVAYIDDMYEDSHGHKMVVVQWFHKVDEIDPGISRTSSDTEIFFSLSLQDLNIECIDGIATVLSPYHFEKYKNKKGMSHFEAFVCHELFDDGEIKPFDITSVKGYWNQQLLKNILPALPPKPPLKLQPREPSEAMKQKDDQDSMVIRPRKKQKLFQLNVTGDICNLNEGSSVEHSKLMKENPPFLLSVGRTVEVLSQDSGIRGCWFRALIIGVFKDSIKVRYQDIVDAIDETNQLEEWISASKVGVSDEFGLRFSGRKAIRPSMRSNQSKSLHQIGVGTVVDAWWHDGWWEGIVVQKEHGDRLQVFFPGEKQESVFPLKYLRSSQEWIGDRWIPLKDRPEVANSIVHLLQRKLVGEVNYGNEVKLEQNHSVTKDANLNVLQADKDIHEDTCPANWKWNCSKGKRSHHRRKVFIKEYEENEKASNTKIERCTLEDFLTHSSFQADPEKYKFISDALFTVQPLSNLVMSI
ncbi:hypothetical protein SAY87_005299 [Trapa incisa]|uniref:BAH domain-containing protein n=1 Tax=Trapa incisa TaxID=236973 RepID=A0AAN7K5M0_9MYRT|nr:hypothetical protein SAY87_005299 [Trapa incisa]